MANIAVLHVALICLVSALISGKSVGACEPPSFEFNGQCVNCRDICAAPENWGKCSDEGCQAEKVELKAGTSTVDTVRASWYQPKGFAQEFRVNCSSGTPVQESIPANGKGPYNATCGGLQPGANVTMTITTHAGSDKAPTSIELQSAATDPVTLKEEDPTVELQSAPIPPSKMHLSKSTIAGTVVGSILFTGLAIFICLAVFCRKQCKANKRNKPATKETKLELEKLN